MISSSQERNTSDLPSYLENSYSLVGTGLKKKKSFYFLRALTFRDLWLLYHSPVFLVSALFRNEMKSCLCLPYVNGWQ